MINVVRSVGTVSVPQLVYFFRDVCPNKTDVELCIKDLMIRHILIYNKAYNWVSFHSAPKEKDEMIRRKVMAFWIIANVASDNVREIYPMGYPSQLIFVVEREGYDPEDATAIITMVLPEPRASEDDFPPSQSHPLRPSFLEDVNIIQSNSGTINPGCCGTDWVGYNNRPVLPVKSHKKLLPNPVAHF